MDEQFYKFCPTCRNPLERKVIDHENRLTCSKCGFVFWNNPKPVVSVVIAQGSKVLMLQRSKEPLKGYWCLPGGFIQYGETAEEAVMREAKEETNLKVQPSGLVGVYRIDNDPRGTHIDIIYSGTYAGEILLNTENATYEFFDKDSLPEQIAYKHREAISDFYKK